MGKIWLSALAITILLSALTGCENASGDLTISAQPDVSSEAVSTETFPKSAESTPSVAPQENYSEIYSEKESVSSKSDIHNSTESDPKVTDDIDLNDYFGEWEIVEDFGFIGVSRDPIDETSLVGEKVSLSANIFRIADKYKYVDPEITAKMVATDDMIHWNKYLNPEYYGFDSSKMYVRIIIDDPIEHFEERLYALNEKEIIFDAGNNHYYRAVKSSGN